MIAVVFENLILEWKYQIKKEFLNQTFMSTLFLCFSIEEKKIKTSSNGNVSILDAIRLMNNAWEKVESRCINNCLIGSF